MNNAVKSIISFIDTIFVLNDITKVFDKKPRWQQMLNNYYNYLAVA